MAARNIPGDDPHFIRRHLTPAKDFVVREKVKTDTIARLSFGDAHPVPSQYADFVIAGFEQGDEEGWSYVYYLKNRAGQEAYNFEVANVLSREWPELEQTFVFRRADYVPQAEAPSSGLPPTFGSAYVWTFMGESVGRGEPWMDGLFIVVNRLWRDTREARQAHTLDAETGAIVTTERRLVPESTAGSAVNNSGRYTEISPLSALISVQTTRQAAGLAGLAENNGYAQRTYPLRDNYPWPAILRTLAIEPIYSDPGDFASSIEGYQWRPVWLAERYNGPCDGELRETWFAKKPIIGGDANWRKGPAWASETVYASGAYRTFDNETYRCEIPHTSGVFATDLAAGKWVVVSPKMPSETPMQPKTIEFHGRELSITNLPACLHPAMTIRDSQFRGDYAETVPAYWPATILGRVTVRPDQGGYRMQEYYYNAPSIDGASPSLTLAAVSVGADSFTLQWTPQAVASPILALTLDVCTNADFKTGFLKGWKAKDITPGTNTPPLQYVVTDMPKDRNLYCRVIRGSGGVDNTSNTVLVSCQPQAEIAIKVDDSTSTNPQTVALGDVVQGTLHTIKLTIQNNGLLSLDNLVATLSGTNSADITVGTLPDSIDPGSSADATLSYVATGTGSRTASLSLASSSLTNNPWVLNFTATAKVPEINLKVGGTSYAHNSTLTVSAVDTGSAGTTTVTVENTGDGTLEMAVSLLPTVAGEYQLITDPPASVAAGATATFDISFAPTAGGTRTAVLSLVHNDPNGSENPYVVNLTGTGNAVGEIEIQDGDGQVLVDGSSTYHFGTVGSVGETRVKTFTIYNRGAGTLSGLSVSKSGTEATEYTLGTLGSTSLAAGASTTFTVTVDPGSTGTRSATLSVASSDADENPFTFDLTTTGGTGPEIVVEYPEGVSLGDGAGSIDFGNCLTDATTVVKTIKIRNIGQSSLTGISASVTGGQAGDYTVGAVASSVAVDGSTTFDVTFNASDYGTRATTLNIASNANNDGGDNVWSIALTGAGVLSGALVTYQPASIVIGQADFDDQLTTASATVLNSPGGMAVSSGGRLAICDQGRHTVRIWNTVPTSNGKAADIVLGTDGSAGTSATLLTLPSSVAWDGNDLLVCDYGNNRVLRFASPTSSGQAAANVIGQTSLTLGAASTARNRLSFPIGVTVDSGRLFVADTINNRILIWNTVPTTNGVNADVVVGQSTFTTATSGSAANRFNRPSGVTVLGSGEMLVADTQNYRVTVFNSVPSVSGASASLVLLQSAFGVTDTGLTASRCQSCWAVAASASGMIAVADSASRRVLIYYKLPTANGTDAHVVLGQADFVTDDEWGNAGSVTDSRGFSYDGFSWPVPLGLCWNGTHLLVSNAAGHRALIFKP